MSGNVVYLDTSAFLKLIVAEAESPALRQFLLRRPERTSASLLQTEAIRALRRAGYEHHVGSARRLFRAMRLIALDDLVLDRAAELDPRELRSLDALHLAAARMVGTDLGAFVTYDRRLAQAAHDQGLEVHSPR
jgi:hypothetical protein